LLSLCLTMTNADYTLRQVHVVTRHGSRRPLSKHAVTLKESISESSLLTPLGQEQHYQLGEWLRERYSSHENYKRELLDQYDPQLAQFESSSYERTLTSAHSLALGLFPLTTRGKQLIPVVPPNVPVYAHDRRNDIAIRGYDKCPTFHDRLDQLYETQNWHDIEQDSMPLLQKLAGIPAFKTYAVQKEKDSNLVIDDVQRGSNNNNNNKYVPLNEMWNIFDLIHVAKVECPDPFIANASSVCQDLADPMLATAVNDEDWQNIQVLAHSVELLKYGRDVAEQRVGGVLWNTILLRMQEEPEQSRLYVTSAHYPTILGLFAALGVQFNSEEDPVIPEYASAVLLELYQDDQSGEKYVKMAYKSGIKLEAVDVMVSRQCRSDQDGGCLLEEFSNILDSKGRVTPEHWCSLCGNNEVDVCIQQELIAALDQSCSQNDTGIMVLLYFAGCLTAAAVLFSLFILFRQQPALQQNVDFNNGGDATQVDKIPDPNTAEVKSISMDDLVAAREEGDTNVDAGTLA